MPNRAAQRSYAYHFQVANLEIITWDPVLGKRGLGKERGKSNITKSKVKSEKRHRKRKAEVEKREVGKVNVGNGESEKLELEVGFGC